MTKAFADYDVLNQPRMEPFESQKHEYFFLSEGGFLQKIQLRMGIDLPPTRRVTFAVLITWLPLLILTAVEGTLWSGAHPFIRDIGIHVRLLVALPMLLLLGRGIDHRIIEVNKYFSETLMTSDSQQAAFSNILHSTRKLAHSVIAEVLMIAAVAGITIAYGKGSLIAAAPDDGAWTYSAMEGRNALSYAGRWANYISIPLYQFILLRWFWRYIAWSIMLLRLARADMSLQATHPDKSGGLAVLMHAQKYFCSLFAAINVGICGELCAGLLANPDLFTSIRNDAAGLISIFLFFLFLPLLFFSTKLVRIKENGLLVLSKAGARLSNRFESDFVDELNVHNKIGDASVDPSTMQDYDTVFVSLDEMRIVPFTVKDLLFVAILLTLPFVPILIIHYSVVELITKLAGLLL